MQNIFIFGTGKLYKEKESYINDHFHIAGFLDNQASGMGHTFEDTGIPVYHPENTEQYLHQDTKIVLMSYRYASMWKQLHGLGVSGKRILFGVMFKPQSEEASVLFGQDSRLTAEDDGTVAYFRTDKKVIVENHGQLQEIGKTLLREKYRKEYPLIHAIANMEPVPASRTFGLERGTSIDRYYIEHFLEENRELIRGDCLEIAENTYTLKYGGDRVKNAYILHVMGWGGDHVIKGNLETGEGIRAEKYDCAIITQTLMFIYDIKMAAMNIFKMLKRGGSALVTVAGISQISRYDAANWGSYYGFHEDAVKALFEPLFGKENVTVHTCGNVKTAIAMLYGLCREDLREKDFEAEDPDYPVIISVVLKKQ